MEIKLKLKVKDVEIELTTDEAKELAKALQNLVEPNEVYIPSWWPSYPIKWTYTTTTNNPDWIYIDANTRVISDNVSLMVE